MRHFIKGFLVILLLSNSIFLSNLVAKTIYSSSCSAIDVQTAITSASNGDSIIIPIGSSSWSNAVEINKGITIIGSGTGLTIITRTGDDQLFHVDIGTHKQPIRITEFTLDGNGGYGIRLDAGTNERNTLLRIDHNKFQNCSRGILMYGWIFGVIDHNEFLDGLTTDVTIYGDGDASWARGGDVGAADAIYIEDNVFTNIKSSSQMHCVASNKGSRYVFRYNKLNTYVAGRPFDPVDVHGYCSVQPRGSYLFEIYENTFNTFGSGSIGRGVRIRGGRGVIFNNMWNGIVQSGILVELVNYRSCDNLAESAACDPVGNTKCHDNEGYPCKDQLNNLYIWNNKNNGVITDATVLDCDYNREHIQEGRDYYNFQKPDYEPYTYPHPLVILPPQNIKFIKEN